MQGFQIQIRKKKLFTLILVNKILLSKVIWTSWNVGEKHHTIVKTKKQRMNWTGRGLKQRLVKNTRVLNHNYSLKALYFSSVWCPYLPEVGRFMRRIWLFIAISPVAVLVSISCRCIMLILTRNSGVIISTVTNWCCQTKSHSYVLFFFFLEIISFFLF